MALSQGIQQKQSGSLTLTPQLRQAIKLLELSNLELETYLTQEILDNPLLELASEETIENDDPTMERDQNRENSQNDEYDSKADRDLDPYPSQDSAQALNQEKDAAINERDSDSDHDFIHRDKSEQGLEVKDQQIEESGLRDSGSDTEDYDNLWTNQSEADRWQSGSSSGPSSGSFSSSSALSSDLESFEHRLIATPKTLQEHLRSQLHTDFSKPMDLLIGACLIEGLDENGYLTTPLKEIAATLKCSKKRVQKTLSSLQKCDPPGVFAQDLVECLRLQLVDRGCLSQSFEKILTHVHLFAEGKIDQLMKVTSLTREELADALHRIQSLNPKPGLLFEQPAQEHFQPDVFVRWHEQQQEWRIHLNEATLPKILIDTGYYARVTQEGKKEVNAYLKERMKSANWLLKALDQRARTILNVSSEIVKQQGEFLEKGLSHLKPMTLKDIAIAVDLHESTISRVTQHKYMMTPRGTFEMKIFFSSSVASMTDEGAHSSSSVQLLLKHLIESETSSAPYSDDQLVQALAEKGIDVARRTISKYRKIMNIPSSYERKKHHLRQL